MNHQTFDEAMQQVLQRRKYDRLMDRAFDFERFVYNLINRVVDWLAENFNFNWRLPEMADYNTNVFTVIFAVVTALCILAVIVWVVWTIRRREKRSRTMEEIFEELRNKNITLTDLLRESKTYAAKGQHREAVRYAYIAILWRLAEDDIIMLNAYKTNSQLRREVAKNAEHLSRSFKEAVETFNTVWFGHKGITPDALAAYTLRAENFVTEVQTYEK
jgi:AraC-like DNA-binding protein